MIRLILQRNEQPVERTIYDGRRFRPRRCIAKRLLKLACSNCFLQCRKQMQTVGNFWHRRPNANQPSIVQIGRSIFEHHPSH